MGQVSVLAVGDVAETIPGKRPCPHGAEMLEGEFQQ